MEENAREHKEWMEKVVEGDNARESYEGKGIYHRYVKTHSRE
jgi:hypothetical protein